MEESVRKAREVWYGPEVENLPANGQQTLFVLWEALTHDEIIQTAEKYNLTHIFLEPPISETKTNLMKRCHLANRLVVHGFDVTLQTSIIQTRYDDLNDKVHLMIDLKKIERANTGIKFRNTDTCVYVIDAHNENPKMVRTNFSEYDVDITLK